MTTYSISLDDVDLAFLPLHMSYNNFLKKDHFNFEVKKTVVFEVPEPKNTYTCHICAIDMPAAFAREHAASVKHRANVRIASVAARRMFALITAQPPPDEQCNARFCAHCATIADEHHNDTKQHKDAVKYDAMLWDLVKAYARDERNPDEENNLYKNEHNDEEHNGYPTNNDRPIEQGNVEHKHTQVEKNTTNKFEINNNLKPRNDEFDDSNFTQANDTEDTSESSDDNDNDDDHQIVHPYEVAASGHVRCVVCDCKVTGGKRNRDEHVEGRRHRYMAEELEENSEDGETDNVSVSTDVTESNEDTTYAAAEIEYPYELTAKGHVRCVVCDRQVPSGLYNRDQHSKGIRHRNMVFSMTRNTDQEEHDSNEDKLPEASAITEPNGTAVSNTSNAVNTTSNTVNTTSSAVNATSNTVNTTSNTANATSNAVRATSNIVNTASNAVNTSSVPFEIGYPYEASPTGRIRCVVCDCTVPGGERNRKQHVRGLRHRNMVIEVKMEEQDSTICNTRKIANVEENSKNEELIDDIENDAINGDDDNTDDSQMEYPFEITETGEIQCVVCNSLVPNSVNDREEHIKEKRHGEIEAFLIEMSEKIKDVQLHINNALKIVLSESG